MKRALFNRASDRLPASRGPRHRSPGISYQLALCIGIYVFLVPELVGLVFLHPPCCLGTSTKLASMIFPSLTIRLRLSSSPWNTSKSCPTSSKSTNVRGMFAECSYGAAVGDVIGSGQVKEAHEAHLVIDLLVFLPARPKCCNNAVVLTF